MHGTSPRPSRAPGTRPRDGRAVAAARSAIAPALSLALAACAVSRLPAPAPDAPAFVWQVTRSDAPDRPLYLAGALHFGRPDLAWPPSLRAAFARAEVLVVEADAEATPQDTVRRLTRELGTYRPPDGLSAHVSLETETIVRGVLTRLGLSAANAERLRPWALATVITVAWIQKAGYSGDLGVDATLLREARGAKAIVELESMPDHLRLLANLPERTQERMLRSALEDVRAGVEALDRMSAAWERGDAAAFEALVFADEGEAEVREVLYFARNRKMAERIAPLVGAPRTHLVVVGAGHLVGDEGLVALLRRRGFEVRQLTREERPGRRAERAIPLVPSETALPLASGPAT